MPNGTRIQILRAAREAFCKYGYEKTSVEDIAKLSNRAKTSLYYYFTGKPEIFEATIREEFLEIRRALEPETELIPGKSVEAFRSYLKKSMELIVSSALFRGCFHLKYNGTPNDIGAAGILIGARRDFDEWEKELFSRICLRGREVGIFNSNINPKDFAEMFEMLLKGVETQFFITKDMASTRATYNEMVDFIIK